MNNGPEDVKIEVVEPEVVEPEEELSEADVRFLETQEYLADIEWFLAGVRA